MLEIGNCFHINFCFIIARDHKLFLNGFFKAKKKYAADVMLEFEMPLCSKIEK